MSWERFKSNYAQKQKEAYEWQAFHSKFMELAHEEQGQAVVVTKGALLRRMDQLLCACSYRKHPEGWEMGKPEQGLVSLLDTPPHGVWNYCSNGVSENFRERVRLCVAKAGRTLSDNPNDADPEDFWLHRLYLDLLENDSDQLLSVSKEGGMIVSVCVASATFCSRLEKQALRSIGLDSAAAEHFRTVADQAESSSVQNNEKTAQSAESREAVLKPILASRGLSIHDWATKAGVDFHTANNYLKGKTDHPYPGTLKKLADALDIEVAKLPK